MRRRKAGNVSHSINDLYREYTRRLKKEIQLYRIKETRLDRDLENLRNSKKGLVLIGMTEVDARKFKRQCEVIENRKARLYTKIEVAKKRMRIPVSIYKRVIKVYMKNYVEQLFLGRKLPMKTNTKKKNLGYLHIQGMPNKPKKTLGGRYTLYVALGQTMKYKQELLDKGIPEEKLFKKEKYEELTKQFMEEGYEEGIARTMACNDERCGIPYLKYSTDEFNYFINWVAANKSGAKCRRHKLRLYRFKPTAVLGRRCIEIKHNPELMELFPKKTLLKLKLDRLQRFM